MSLPIPNDNPILNSVWYDGDYYTGIDSESGTVYGYRSENMSCGCCSQYVNFETDWDTLEDDAQREIYEELGLAIPQGS